MAQRVGIRQLPGIYRYPAEGTGQAVNQGGIADKYLFVLGRIVFCRGRMFFYSFDKTKEYFFIWEDLQWSKREDTESTADSMCRKF